MKGVWVVLKVRRNQDTSARLRWYFGWSVSLSVVIKKPKMHEINVYGASFTGLCACAGGCE